MQHISMTPFGRSLRASDVSGARLVSHDLPLESRDKWAVMKDLTVARRAFQVSDRDLAVLNALVSFHPHPTLAEGHGTIVFPSNDSLSARAHGMAESTLRRHLAALVKAGLILRHDSPNGKRYARRSGNQIYLAYGFDLRPLLLRDAEIIEAAEAARAVDSRRKAMREAVVLTLRDVTGLLNLLSEQGTAATILAEAHDSVADTARLMRRKLCLSELERLLSNTHALRETLKALITLDNTEDLHGKPHQNERHIQDSNRLPKDSERAEKTENPHGQSPAPTLAPQMRQNAETDEAVPAAIAAEDLTDTAVPDLTLPEILQACPDALDYATTPITNWEALVRLAIFIAPMMGINAQTLAQAQAVMGPIHAAITVLALLQRAQSLRNPGGYLRRLTQEAATTGFTPTRMIRALHRPRLQAA